MNESENQRPEDRVQPFVRPDPILPTGRHPFMRKSDEYGQRIILKMNRPQTLPQFTGQILVRMLPVLEHYGPWEIVRVEEGFMEYMDGDPADPEEWECWADLVCCGS